MIRDNIEKDMKATMTRFMNGLKSWYSSYYRVVSLNGVGGDDAYGCEGGDIV
jgi:hypothetical protein